jgi:hypothetical protein
MQGGMAGLFQVFWGQQDGRFKQAVTLNGTDDKPLIIPIEERKYQTENICTRPTAVDWDADGDLDLIVGNFAGSFYIFKGEGTGKFSPDPELLKSDNNQTLKIVGVHSDPFVIDWDGDGDLDLLSGSSNGGVQWAENHGGKGQKRPVLRAFKTLISPCKKVAYGTYLSEDELQGPASSTRIWVDDVNSDGKLDILVGDRVSLTTPANGLTKAEAKAQQAKWQKELQVAQVAMRDAKLDAEQRQLARQRYSKLSVKRGDFVTQERTGFVWLYLQK